MTKSLEVVGEVTGIARAVDASLAELPGDERQLSQWMVKEKGVFVAGGPSVSTLPGGVYNVSHENGLTYFGRLELVRDDLIQLPDSTAASIVHSIRRFWTREAYFRKLRQIFKRGVLIYGPPGSGKTATVVQVVEETVAVGGIGVIGDCSPGILSKGLQSLRSIEPKRPLVVVLEDIDDIIRNWGESTLLNILDGANQVDNVVYLATTNYPENLDGRIKDRPSRFDEVRKVGLPSLEARAVFFKAKASEALSDDEIQSWAEATDGLGVAHLRELVVAVLCLDNDFGETVERLKGMKRPVKSDGNGAAPGFTATGGNHARLYRGGRKGGDDAGTRA